MKNDKYEDAPDNIRRELTVSNIIEDFLPPPDKLIPHEETRKVTIALSRKSVDFFKEQAKETHIPYQQMIRNVLDRYTNAYSRDDGRYPADQGG